MDVIISPLSVKNTPTRFQKALYQSLKTTPAQENRHMLLGILLFLQWKMAGSFGSAGVRSQRLHFLSTFLLSAGTAEVKPACMRIGKGLIDSLINHTRSTCSLVFMAGMAEREGFEPSRHLVGTYTISSRTP